MMLVFVLILLMFSTYDVFFIMIAIWGNDVSNFTWPMRFIICETKYWNDNVHPHKTGLIYIQNHFEQICYRYNYHCVEFKKKIIQHVNWGFLCNKILDII